MSAFYLREIEASPTESQGTHPAEVQKQQALVVGINSYPAGFRALDNALSDAKEVADTLHDEYGFDLYPRGDPLLAQTASLAGLKDAIQTSLTEAGEETRWLFFFAGHGTVTDGAMYLIPADAVYGDTNTYLSLNWLLELCRANQPVEILIVLDACYSGWAMVRGESLDDLSPSPDEIRVRQIISSGNPRQPVLDAGGRRHSVFTQALLDGLQGWSGIHEPDGRVRFARLLDHLVYEIPGRLRAAGFDTYSQQPIGGYFVGNRDRREFVFCATVDRLPPDILRDIANQDPGRRVSGLRQLSNVISNRTYDMALTTQAIQIATQHAQSRQTICQEDQFLSPEGSFRSASSSIEPVPQVRTQAVATLGELLQLVLDQSRLLLEKHPQLVEIVEDLLNMHLDTESALSMLGKLSLPDLGSLSGLLPAGSTSRLVETAQTYIKPAVQMLICALDDSPEISGQAAQALSKLSLPVVAKPILDRISAADPTLFLDLVDAIGEVGNDPITIETLQECLHQGRLVPFIGPDFSKRLTGLPDLKTINRGLAKCEQIELGASLAETAAGSMYGSSRYPFTNYLQKVIDDQLLQPGEIHKALARLKAPFWISGAYDSLLGKALNANEIVMGGDTRYWRAGLPTVVRLVGDPTSLRGVVVIEDDYKQLRQNEGDRRLLLSFMREELEGKVVLFLGYDPDSLDFGLLVQYVLNDHLQDTNIRAFLVWTEAKSNHTWGEHPIHIIDKNGLELINDLVKPG